MVKVKNNDESSMLVCKCSSTLLGLVASQLLQRIAMVGLDPSPWFGL